MIKNSKNHLIQIKNPGLKAFIYQQIHELQAFLLPDSQVGLIVEKEALLKKTKDFTVTLILTGGGTFVRSEAKAKSIFKAISKAKEGMLNHLHMIQRQVLEENEDSTKDSLNSYLH